jgi:hypothetical protein
MTYPWNAGDILTAADLNAEFGSKAANPKAINTQTANYTLALVDLDKRVQMNNSAARTITIPPNLSVAFPVGSCIDIANINTGVLTIAGGSGVTVNGRALTLGQWETATVIQRAANVWVVEPQAGLTAALASKLDSNNASALNSVTINTNTSDAVGSVVALTKARGAAKVENNDTLGSIVFSGFDGSQFRGVAGIFCDVNGATGADDVPSRLTFTTTPDGSSTPVSRLIINNAGEVGIGQSPAADYRLAINGSFLMPNNGRIETNGGTLVSDSILNSTTANAANVSIATTAPGFLQRSTSSRRYKTDVEPLGDDYADKVLQLEPVWFRSTCELDVKNHPDWSYYGLIAEQVAEVEPRAVFWGKDEEGNPQPEGVQYDRLVPHLISVVKRQQEQIDALTARLDAAGF